MEASGLKNFKDAGRRNWAVLEGRARAAGNEERQS
jgi:hypothetical protein